MNEDMGAVAAEAIPLLQTTSVDGRAYVSIEDLLILTHDTIDTLLGTYQVALDTIDNAEHLFVVHQRADGMASVLGLFDTILHACEDKEGLESLSPGDFV